MKNILYKSDVKKLLLLVAIVAAWGLYNGYKDYLRYKTEGARYSIGTIVDENRQGAYLFSFGYDQGEIKVGYVNKSGGDWYDYRLINHFKHNVKGRKVYVVFPSKSPKHASFYANFKVPEHLPEPPPEGWTLEELQALDPGFQPGESDWW